MLLKCQLHWAGHVIHMEDHRLANVITYRELSKGTRYVPGPTPKALQTQHEDPSPGGRPTPKALQTQHEDPSPGGRPTPKALQTQHEDPSPGGRHQAETYQDGEL